MEYAICRGMEINRLSSEQLVKLQVAERNRGIAFNISEIQEAFRLPLLKVAYMIPEIETAQGNHVARLRSEFYRAGVFPEFKDLSVLDVNACHAFDDRMIGVQVDYVYSGGKERRVNIREGLEENVGRQSRMWADLE